METTDHRHPNEDLIVPLLQSVSKLIDSDAWELAEHRSDAQHDDRATAINAALNAGGDQRDGGSALDDAARAARKAAKGMHSSYRWYQAVCAAREAYLALTVRDLIGQDGFTQAHYDLLVRPWATAIGPVHPDDIQGMP